MRSGRATRGKWRIPDGKVGERSVVMFGEYHTPILIEGQGGSPRIWGATRQHRSSERTIFSVTRPVGRTLESRSMD
jgi:hypothetical protein